MQKIKFYLIIILLILIGCSKEKKIYTIGFIQLLEDPVLDTARIHFINSLKENDLVEGKDFKIDYQNAQGEQSNIFPILNSFVTKKVDMIATITTPCLLAAVSIVKDIPVVFTIAYNPYDVGAKNVGKNIVGYYQPKEQDSLMKLILQMKPNLQTIGYIYNPSETNSRFSYEIFKALCLKHKINFVDASINSSNDIVNAALYLAQKKVECFVTIADNTVNQSMPALEKIAVSKEIPIITDDPSKIDEYIAISYGINYVNWSKETGKMASQIIKGKDISEFSIQPYNIYTLGINLSNSKKQGLKIPIDIIQKADKVID